MAMARTGRRLATLLVAFAAAAAVIALVINVSGQHPVTGTTAAGTRSTAVHSRKLLETALTPPDFTNQTRPVMFTRNCLQDVVMVGIGALVQATEKAVDSFLGDPSEIDLCVYGNWCGGGCSGVNGAPIDDVDAACKVHDDCYTVAGSDNCAVCKCDAELIAEMDKVMEEANCSCFNPFCWKSPRFTGATTTWAGITAKSKMMCSACPTADYASEVIASRDNSAAQLAELLQASSEVATAVSDALTTTLGPTWTDAYAALTSGLSPAPSSPTTSPSLSPSLSPSPLSYSPSPDFSPSTLSPMLSPSPEASFESSSPYPDDSPALSLYNMSPDIAA